MVTNSIELMKLAELVEQATGPDRQLDGDIAAALGFPNGPSSGWCNSENGDHWHVDQCAAYFTESLDSAMTLVPASDDQTLVFWRSGNDGEGGNPDSFKAEVLVVTGFTSERFTATAATEILARAAAALKARARASR